MALGIKSDSTAERHCNVQDVQWVLEGNRHCVCGDEIGPSNCR